MSRGENHDGPAVPRLDYRSLMRLYRVFGPHYAHHWRRLAVAYAGLAGTVAVTLLLPWPLKMILDHVVLHRPMPAAAGALTRWVGDRPESLLLVLVLGYIALRLLESLCSYVHQVGLMSVGQMMATEIRERLFAHLQRLSLAFHDSTRAGDLMLRMVSDISDVKIILIEVPQNFAYRLAMIVSHIGLMMFLNWRLALVAFSMIPILYVFNRRVGSDVRAAASVKRSKESEVASLIAENVTAMALVQAYGREDLQQARFESENRASLASGIRAMRLSKVFKRTSDILVAVASCGVIYWGGRMALEGAISPGTVVLFAAYLRNLYAPIDKFAQMVLDAAGAQASADRLLEIFERDTTVKDDADAIQAPAFRGRVEFEGVSFGYREDAPVLEELSFAVEPGETVAVIGHNGAGKSTVLSLLLRFYDPGRGRILIDGRDLRSMSLESVRRQMTVVLQEARLFNKTVRDNIGFGKIGASEEEIVRAARLAQAHDFIMRMPGGYDAVIHEGGENLSGGERQRLNIARAIVREAAIVILDEPATALDARTEALVSGALRELTRGRTTFIIAHKLPTVSGADKILMLERGTRAAFGTHEELLASSPEYREFQALQAEALAPFLRAAGAGEGS